jgi:hypothetical protein
MVFPTDQARAVFSIQKQISNKFPQPSSLLFCSNKEQQYISSTGPLSGSGRFIGTHNENHTRLSLEFSIPHFNTGKFVLQVLAHTA